MKVVVKGMLVLLVIGGGAYGAYRYAPGIMASVFVATLPKKEGVTHVIESTHGSSPDGKWEFTVERLDNGLGFGLGALYDEVHVHRAGSRNFGHGDGEKTSVFYIEATDRYGEKPVARWTEARHLLITYAAGLKPGKSLERIEDVVIESRSAGRQP